MSSHKRQDNSDGSTKSNGHSQSILRKRQRLSSVKDLEPDGVHMEPEVIQDNSQTNPLHTAFRPHFWPLPSYILGRGRVSNQDEQAYPAHSLSENLTSPFSPNSEPYSNLPLEQFDVLPGIPASIPLADDEDLLWRAEDAAFIKSPAGLDGTHWIGKRPLGSGFFGKAGLWERRDENNVLVQEVVIKESNTISLERWTGQVPEEVKMMQRMKKTGCKAVPKLIDYKRYMHARKHRIYMEYCPHGDLHRLNVKYKRFRAYFPEPFLWHTFKDLVNAAAAMQNGPRHTTWGYQIVHRDLKPGNIFLGLEDKSNEFQMYPTAKTGDWGLATKIKQDDHHNNPFMIRGAGTDMYEAPEQKLPHPSTFKAQIRRHQDGISPIHKLSASTNIWAIGAIMFELLTHEAADLYLWDEQWAVNGVLKDIPNFRKPKYSSALTELIELCLLPDPRDRPSIEELEIKIGARCQSILDEYAVNPSLQRKERLYYRGSEINEMPGGDWNFWQPLLDDDVPRPSDPPDPNEPKNPSTRGIVYPRYPSSESSTGKDSTDSDDSKAKRRMAIKTVPGP